jgi:membrane-associated protease RseP (regulator of RpoE activity)
MRVRRIVGGVVHGGHYRRRSRFGDAMLKTLLLVVAGLVAGLAIAYFTQPSAPPLDAPAAVATAARGAVGVGGSVVDVARLDTLEAALQSEVEQRAVLEARVAELAAELEVVRGRAPQPGEGPAESAGGEPGAERGRPRFQRDVVALRDDIQRRQVELLIAAGFAPDRAEWINRRTSELRMQQLQAQYDATREGRAFDPGTQLAGERTLRSELGDTDYERYLKALDRPTSVAVQDVLASSPAERSGLKPGDEVVAYGGQRVFDMRELNALTLAGNAGESVVVEVRRDGQNLQLVMPRGPIGIFGGGMRGR